MKSVSVAELKKQQRNLWQSVYAEDPGFFGKRSNFAVKASRVFRDCGAGRILELGCGSGRDTFYFASKRISVYAIDFSNAAIAFLRNRAKSVDPEHFVKARVYDLRNGLPEFPKNSFDAAYSHMFFSMPFSLRELARILGHLHRSLKPGAPNLFSVRSVEDKQLSKGKAIDGKTRLYFVNDFAIRFFDTDLIRYLCSASSFHIDRIENGREGLASLYLVYSTVVKKV
jgi:SAM-dependent methyltransferase